MYPPRTRYPASRLILAGAFAAALFATQTAYGQECIGVPIPRSSFAGQVDVSFGDEANTYGASVTGNLKGPLSVGAGYGFTNVDAAGNAHNFSGRLAFELIRLPVSVCALTGLRYVSVSDGLGPLTTSSVTIPSGIALSHGFPISSNVTLTPYVVPQLLVRFSDVADDGNGQQVAEDSDTQMAFALRKGLVVGIQRFFGGVTVELTSLEGPGTVLGITFGMRL